MTLPYERKNAVQRTHELLVDLLWERYDECTRGSELWEEVSRCLKHYPSDFYMDDASKLAPEVFGDWKQDEKLTRIEIIGDDGREVVKYAPEGHYYRRSVQDNGRTVKFFVEKKNGEHECPGVGKCQDQGCPAHYASDELEKKNG